MKTQCCEILKNQVDVIELALKQLKLLSRNLEDMSVTTINTNKLEEGLVDVEKQIERLTDETD